MNKLILPLFILFLYSNVSFSQNNTAETTLNIVLNTIQSIKINDSQKEVGISLTTVSDYTNGKATKEQEHIEVMSNTKYQVTVSASGDLKDKNNVSIPINTVTLTPSFGAIGTTANNGVTLTPVSLSLSDNTFVSSTQGDTKRSFDVEYRVSGGEAYINKPVGSYSTLVTYTILVP